MNVPPKPMIAPVATRPSDGHVRTDRPRLKDGDPRAESELGEIALNWSAVGETVSGPYTASDAVKTVELIVNVYVPGLTIKLTLPIVRS